MALDLEHMAEATCALRLLVSVCMGVEEAGGEPLRLSAHDSGGRLGPAGTGANLWASCRSPKPGAESRHLHPESSLRGDAMQPTVGTR